MTNEEYMALAIKEADMAAAEGQKPFGVVVVDTDGNIVWKDHDRVRECHDPTAHGEVNAIRYLCRKMKTLSLSGFTFYTTSEPCPTCFSAMLKANVSRVIYGAKTIETASLPIPIEELNVRAKRPIQIVGGIFAKEALEQRNRLIAR
ncbi:MAG: hypothetical protein UW73_C0005G0012 [Microgenomates group bacterium GW2011_GWB1_44_8]|nr:MAG: hypothetical protein UW73_C0005G0012 [Microgenomates group bacterium GW2011_GWB1_44_8]